MDDVNNAAFQIKDLNSLLKNLESEISVNEQNLVDENEKRVSFKVNISLTLLLTIINKIHQFE